MIQLKKIVKTYVNKKDRSKNVEALKDITIDFPRQGFVSILGPSGCGKTTLLNILGGLDTNYSGDFVVNGISTKQFKQKDWDAYRNNHVGFVFQEYNLIPHQNVSKNVELVLTIAGAQKIETKEKAKKVLTDVGLEYKINDNPNKLSGGQKQRVAIARALVNDPELILADEPTSALDSRTSEQVMNILKEISKKKLVVMVTHNVELAKKYSSKIINILDGRITEIEDVEKEAEKEEFLNQLPQRYKYGKSKMRLKTAFGLSFKNLMTKKRRTILTVLAGSLGIICLTVILGIINGANSYAKDIYNNVFVRPLTITKTVQDRSAMFGEDAYKKSLRVMQEEEQKSKNSTKVQTDASVQDKFDKAIGDGKTKEKIHNNILNDNFKNYMLDLLRVSPQKVRGILVDRGNKFNFMFKSEGRYVIDSSRMFKEMPYTNKMDDYFELVGNNSRWPSKRDEVVVQLNNMNVLNKQLEDILGVKGKKNFDISEILGKEIGAFVPHNLVYRREGGMFSKISSADAQNIYNNPGMVKLKIVGAFKNKYSETGKDANFERKLHNRKELLPIETPVLYTHELGDYIYKTTAESDIVNAQKNSKQNILLDSKDSFRNDMFMMSRFKKEEEKKDIPQLLADIGYSEVANKVKVYMNSPVEDEEYIKEYIEKYNQDKKPEDKILLEEEMFGYKSRAKDIKMVSYFLLATIGLASLLSSLIMIALLEFISVLERIKEIGVLRSVGARKKDISRLFKSEAVIVGLFTGVSGVFIGILCSMGLNKWVRTAQGLPESSRLIQIGIFTIIGLILFSVLVTLLAGLIPAKIASRKDPVRILTGTNN